MKIDFITKQHPVKLLGIVRQVYGGASSWVTLVTMIFAGTAAWNTSTLAAIRTVLPWLNFYTFIGFVFFVGLIVCWFEYIIMQPSAMAYWNQLHFDHNNPQYKHEKALEEVILKYVIKDDKEREEAQKILDEADKK